MRPLSSQQPNGHPKATLSHKTEDNESSSSSSDERTADPFNPDSSVSDNEYDERNDEPPRSFSSPTDHPQSTSGSAPHPAPSENGSTLATPAKRMSTYVSTTEIGENEISQVNTPSPVQAVGYKSPENDGNTSSSSRTEREKKPPPPPRNHHGKRINAPESTSRPESIRSTSRFSFHASSPESVISVQPSGGTSNANTASQPTSTDYFLMPSENQQALGSTDSLQRSQSQSKRPPTPPLSRRQSQMRRSKSTQSKSSNSRLTLSSLDSESNDSSQPPSPGPPPRSVASKSQDRKRASMPPPASATTSSLTMTASATILPATEAPTESLSPPASSRPLPSQPGRRVSSYGSPSTGSSLGAPPPPPPPRRGARESQIRNSDGGTETPVHRVDSPLPQPSNASDILADLSRLQKEVDDLRGHYESRKVSQ
ncbi:hypothetical protein N7450_009867 [Penicillium hetheringtonii]|uniref:Uncharacterized protein n=1 Tax=Penicillium hetheringtonii TaxID=911720 RepID=A0AAD6DDF2_9EURO|nr:hypothetical protein N7450_009867 [Penicillium hetheringtonii]